MHRQLLGWRNTSQILRVWSKQEMLTPAPLAVRPECGGGLGTATGRAERTIRPGGLPRTRGGSGLPGTRRRGRRPARRATRQVGPRVTHFRPAFRFEGPQTLQQQNQRAGGRRLGCSPRPPATCSRQGRTGPGAALPCPARGLGLTAGRALRPTFPAATAPPRETRGGPWPLLNSRKGAAAAEDARPDCAASGPTREQKVAGPAAFSQVPLPRLAAPRGPAPSPARVAGP